MTQSRLFFFLSELRRRRVFHVAGGYALIAWGAIQVAATTFPYVGLSGWAVTTVIVLAAAGLPVALLVAWLYELTPAGLRRDEADAPAATVRDVRIWGVTFVVAACLLVAGFGLGVRYRTTPAAVVAADGAAAPAVAVLPFDIVGRDLDVWPEGIVYLLSFNLDGLKVLRKVDPAVVLTTWDRHTGGATSGATPALALAVAGAVGASFVVTGNAVRTGRGVRVTAEVHDVARGVARGSVSVDEPVDSIHLIVDRLTVELLTQGLLPGEPEQPRVNLAGLTTTSLPALKAYLTGEWLYRRSRFRDAVAEFERAVDTDSTFARAHYRLSSAYVWTHEYGAGRRSLATAATFADRLPERDALLIRGAAAPGADRIRMLEELTRRFPDDVDGWYELGEAYFHIGGQNLVGSSAYRNAWDTALQWGRPYGESYSHLIEDAFGQRDTARARRLIRQMESIAEDAAVCSAFGVVFALTWGDAATRTAAEDALARMPYDELECAWSALAAAQPALERIEIMDSERLTERHPAGTRTMALWRSLQPRVVRGQIAAARQILDSVEAVPVTQHDAARFHIMLHISGYPDPTGAQQARDRIEQSTAPLDRFWIAALAGSEERWQDVEQAVAALRAFAAAPIAPVTATDPYEAALYNRAHAEAFAAALQEWAALRQGRTTDPIQLERALSRMPAMSYRWEQPQQFLRYDVALILLEQGRRDDARRYLESFYPYDYVYFTPAQYLLGTIHEAAGRPAVARPYYQRFVDWWQDCDAQLQQRRADGAAALIRLAGEGMAVDLQP
jgi:tetratricopeptide (TPR) repeat protein/TolB-like protein